jgi:RimJ/RimL family protein N-acetyltransferase
MAVVAPHPRLRAWTEAEFPAWEVLHQDPGVAQWLGGAWSAETSRRNFERAAAHVAERGWGVWAVLDADGQVVGAAGLQATREGLPFFGVEAVWRLLSEAQGKGLISTVMPAILADGFDRLPNDELLAYTARANARSQAVMHRLGFLRDETRDFDHPALALGHPLRSHVMYRLPRPPEGRLQEGQDR